MGQVHFHNDGDPCNERCTRITPKGNVPILSLPMQIDDAETVREFRQFTVEALRAEYEKIKSMKLAGGGYGSVRAERRRLDRIADRILKVIDEKEGQQ